ncbi:MAG: hypothetical protein V3T05_14220 [Myxococcota bacterium]
MDCVEDAETMIFVIVAVIVTVGRLARFLRRVSGTQAPQRSPEPGTVFLDDEYGEDEYGEEAIEREVQHQHGGGEPVVTVDPIPDLRQQLEQRLDRVRQRANTMERTFVLEMANRRLVHPVEVYIPELLGHARAELVEAPAGSMELLPKARSGLDRAGRILDEAEGLLEVIEYLALQRRDPDLAAALGDADQLAEACYRPVLTFAQAEGLEITSNHPIVSLGRFDLQIWTGLIPTSLAPIFLPTDFFSRVAWWPALTHEIGHDFYASVDGFDGALRQDLRLPSAVSGAQLIRSPNQSLELSDIEAMYGVWLEEIFCDVFGTLMTGPAYVAAMLELFRADDDPGMVVSVLQTGDATPAYDPHPPRHLRLHINVALLGEMGLHTDAADLLREWNEMHQLDGEPIDFLLVPTLAGTASISLEPFVQVGRRIAQRLYDGPLHALKGRGLRAISGLDYGPHRHNETLRARNAFLDGAVPSVRDPRSVIAGAVLAARQAPDREASIMRLARQTIPALGTTERAPGVQQTEVRMHRPGASPAIGPLSADDLIGGMILGEILDRGARASHRV